MWSFNHNFFRNDPIHGDFDVAGVQYQWNDGIFSITLGNPLPDGDRIAYFHAMASVSEFSVPTHILRNESLAARSYHGSDFKVNSKERKKHFIFINDLTKYLLFPQNSFWDIVAIWHRVQCTHSISVPVLFFFHKLQQMLSPVGIQPSH